MKNQRRSIVALLALVLIWGVTASTSRAGDYRDGDPYVTHSYHYWMATDGLLGGAAGSCSKLTTCAAKLLGAGAAASITSGLATGYPYYAGLPGPRICGAADSCAALAALLHADFQPIPLSGVSEATDSLIASVNALDVNQFMSDAQSGASGNALRADLLAMANQMDRVVHWYGLAEGEIGPPDFWRHMTTAKWMAEQNPLPAPSMNGVGFALCGARTGYADSSGWANDAGYGNNWRQTLTSPVFTYDGTGSVDLNLLYFNETQANSDYTRIYVVTDASRTDITGGGWSGSVGINSNTGAITPQPFTHAISNYELGGGSYARAFHIEVEFASDGAGSDEAGFDSWYGPAGIDNVTLQNNLIPPVPFSYNFETNLQGWVPGHIPVPEDAYVCYLTPELMAATRDAIIAGGLPVGEVAQFQNAGLTPAEIDSITVLVIDALGSIDLIVQPLTLSQVLQETADAFRRMSQTGSVATAGYNYHGQCTVPAPNSQYVAISGGWNHSLGLKSDGTIVAWGYNGEGQCNVPSPNTGFESIAGSYRHSLGLKYDGTIIAWGRNADGECNVPTPNANFAAIATGLVYSLGLKYDGTIIAWGANEYGQCNVPSPNAGFDAIAGGSYHGLGLKSDGTILAWGWNYNGQCNVPSPNADFAAGWGHSLGLKSDGTILAWGLNSDGQCNVPSPNARFIAIAAGGYFSLGLKSDGTIVAWGNNDHGQCNLSSPAGGRTVAISGGGEHSLGLAIDPEVSGAEEPVPLVTSGNNQLRILSVAPNPVANTAEILFETRESGPVSVAVHDVGGRQVMASALGSFAPGRHQVRWDATGLKLTSGVYFLRLQNVARGTSAVRILLLR